MTTTTNQQQLGLPLAPQAPAVPAPAPIAVPATATVEDRLQARAPLRPRRKKGSPGPQDIESAARDEALDRLEEAREALIAEAKKVARTLALQRGRITSVEVFQALRAFGYDEALDNADPRWMGCVFRGDGWKRVGWEATGSHKRPVAVWTLEAP